MLGLTLTSTKKIEFWRTHGDIESILPTYHSIWIHILRIIHGISCDYRKGFNIFQGLWRETLQLNNEGAEPPMSNPIRPLDVFQCWIPIVYCGCACRWFPVHNDIAVRSKLWIEYKSNFSHVQPPNPLVHSCRVLILALTSTSSQCGPLHLQLLNVTLLSRLFVKTYVSMAVVYSILVKS